MTYDVDQERARRAEAAGGTHWSFKFGGAEYQLPREVPLEIAKDLEALTAGDQPALFAMHKALKGLLGKQAAKFPFETMSLPDFQGIFDAYFTEIGTSPGESQGSPASSAPTATPSKRTSKPHTKSASRTSTKAR
jgi:hypothetical protein